AALVTGRVGVPSVAHGNVAAPIEVRVGDQRPRVVRKIENRAAVATPAVLVECDFKPICSRTTGNVVNTDRLTGNWRGPIGARLSDAVDGFGLHVDKFAARRVVGLDT